MHLNNQFKNLDFMLDTFLRFTERFEINNKILYCPRYKLPSRQSNRNFLFGHSVFYCLRMSKITIGLTSHLHLNFFTHQLHLKIPRTPAHVHATGVSWRRL